MRTTRVLVVIAIAVAMLVPAVPSHSAAKKPPKLKLTLSNFRFCSEMSCTPIDVGYLRPNGAPIDGTDNPLEIIDVKQGTIVSWVYRDALCDQFSCGGHNVYFENGKTGARKGFVPSNKGPKAINVKITQKKGTTIRYFCTVNGHDQTGMTGILNVI